MAQDNRARHKAESACSDADLEEFAWIISHDLKAPLRGLGHLAEWISEDVQATASAETLENLGLLKSRVSRLQTLLDGLLTYARLGCGTSPAEDVDVTELVNDIAALNGAAPHFTALFEGPLQNVCTHRIPLRAVLENLIGNVLKHHDRATGHIRIGLRRKDGLMEFTVTDDGPGIAPRFHKRIFQIFQTLPSRDRQEASGVGLAIVKKQVAAHGGTVHIESDPPRRGTTFVFTWQEDRLSDKDAEQQ
jgi:light-regulated signal transduction histidine kinase (bacteriophytochrome)